MDLFELESATKVQEVTKHDISISHISTCSSGILVCADISTKISVQKFTINPVNSRRTLTVEDGWAKRMEQTVDQILLSPSGDKLLITAGGHLTVVKTKYPYEEEEPAGKHTAPGAFWSQSPSTKAEFICYDLDASIRHWDWDTLKPLQPHNTNVLQEIARHEERSNLFQRPVLLELFASLLQISKTPMTYQSRSINPGFIIRSSSLSPTFSVSFSSSASNASVQESTFDLLGNVVKQIIGISGNDLLFLDADNWVSSIDIELFDHQEYRRHFFLPRDWLTLQTRLVLCVSSKGEIIVGKSAEVAVCQHDMRDFTARSLKGSSS